MILSPKDKILHRLDRSFVGGGVLIAVHSEIKHQRVFLTQELDLEYVCIHVEGFEGEISEQVLMCIYNPSATDIAPSL